MAKICDKCKKAVGKLIETRFYIAARYVDGYGYVDGQPIEKDLCSGCEHEFRIEVSEAKQNTENEVHRKWLAEIGVDVALR